MKKLWIVLLFLVPSTALAADWAPFVGHWQGTLRKNIKDNAAGGKTAEGGEQTKVDMMFLETSAGLAGYARVGADNLEVWVLEGDRFSWTEGKFRVDARRVARNAVPGWVAQEITVAAGEPRIYSISGCRLLANGDACVEGKDIPKGLLTSAIFTLYFDAQQRLHFGAFYAYDRAAKQRRILTWFGEQQVVPD